jgi:pseudouridine-5'-phosphate glycosidase
MNRAAIHVGAEVREVLDAGGAAVALETSVIGQGLPYPRNLEAVERIERAARDRHVVPAWVAVVDGAASVGVSHRDVRRIAEPGASSKVARRDLPAAAATGLLGATTVSATLWAARGAGVHVAATGGIGGVHPGGRDVSADLIELASTPGLLVCSGPKSIVDPVRTAERLEELGVLLVGFGTDRLPFFVVRESQVELSTRVGSATEAAAVLSAAERLGTVSTIVVCNPVPASHALDLTEVDRAVRAATARAQAAGVRGRELTPYLLARVAEETGGASLEANLALLEANVVLAAEIALARSRGSLPSEG